MHISVSCDFRHDTRRSDNLEDRVGFGADCECDGWEDLRQPSLPLWSRAQGIYVALREIYAPVERVANQRDRRVLLVSVVSRLITSACRFRLMGALRSILAEMDCGERVAEE
jgi:hypothetical protein